MKTVGQQIRLAGSDLSNHLACRHLTALDLQVARGERAAPDWADPNLAIILERGDRHQDDYLAYLVGQGLTVENLEHIDHRDEERLLGETLALMERGAVVIAQGALSDGEWFGRPDVLRRVEKPSKRWKWSYEVVDTKLARETKATTILQLSLYSDLLAKVQEGTVPEFLWVVPPGEGFAGEKYRVSEYAAYYRHVKNRLASAISGGPPRKAFPIGKSVESETYPEPVEHCKVCRWFKECDTKRRGDDHLSLVAGMRRQQQRQLEEWKVETMAKLAALPIPLQEKPRRGSREAIESLGKQARVQVKGRLEERLVHEPILPVTEGTGFFRLPEANRLDMFVDLEGDSFAGELGQQYLFGFSVRDADRELVYEKRWTLTAEEEKRGFEWVMDEIMRRWSEESGMHVYHYGANEPSAFKRLMGQYATREEEMDGMLRAGVFVDLLRVVKQAIRASVEEYSLKKMEAFYGFARKTSLDASRAAMRHIEHHLELGWKGETIRDEQREAMEGYNREDCESTAALRDWLEAERAKLIAKGHAITRPVMGDPEPPEELSERQKRVADLVARLTRDLPADRMDRSEAQQAQWLLAQLLDWHRREDKATYWEKFRLDDLDEDELLEEKSGLGGLQFMERLRVERRIPTDRYRFEKQETEARKGHELYHKLQKFGTVVDISSATRTVDIKKTRNTAELHPIAVYLWDRPYDVDDQKDAIFRIAKWVADMGIDAKGNYRAARDLMLRYAPRLRNNETVPPLPMEAPVASANRIAMAMQDTVFAIQGPPGAGKTYTGARMICQLVKQGKKVGVTALANKVIRKLLGEVVLAAKVEGIQSVRCMQKWKDGEPSEEIALAESGEIALGALRVGNANVVGGTSFMWAEENFFEAVNVLFIDEAGQMALADVISVAHAAKSLVLIGDPQQLERPLKGSHPDGAEKSALEHLLGDHKTILPDVGLLLPETWRLHPNISKFTSEMFYEGRLKSREVLKNYVIDGHPWVKGGGLWFAQVEHEGNRNSAAEEVEAVVKIVEGLLKPEVKWQRGVDRPRKLTAEDVLIVAPYNAQVSDLLGRLPGMRVGTVDKFQGQEAPIVIYSLTTSSPEDAPRGMEFLYSLNRLNVATSRAMTTVILVGSPRLFEPECRTPRQMQLANAFCGYLEMAITVDPSSI
jgi:predicted RecB family nuclease